MMKEGVKACVADDLAVGHTLLNALWGEFLGGADTRRAQDFGYGFQGVVVIVGDAVASILDIQGTLARRILGRYASWALVRAARLALDAAKREHKAPCQVAVIGAKGQCAENIEPTDDFAATTNLDSVADAGTAQQVVHEYQAVSQGHADMVRELFWRSSCPTL